MASPTPAAHLPTRQQLDEIDALLQRMLSLPAVADEPAAPAAAPAAPPVEFTFPAPVVHEVPPVRPPDAGEPAVHAWRVEWPQPPAPPPVADWGSPVPLATLADDPDPPADPPPAADFPVAELVAEAPPAAEPVPFHLWPLIGLNAAFNVLTHVLGPTGAWLRGSGRAVLGWLGVGMILAAGVWAAGAWLGYDWPKLDLSRLGLRS